MFASIVAKTIRELVTDLKRNKVVSVAVIGTEIENMIVGKSDSEITRLIHKRNSDLCKCIPKDILANDPSGRRYLEILSMIQPNLKPGGDNVNGKGVTETSSLPTETSSLPNAMQISHDATSTSNDGAKHVSDDDMLAKFKSTFGNVMPPELFNFVQILGEDLKCEQNEFVEALQSMDMTKLMSLFGNVKDKIEKSMSSGEIDTNVVQTQAVKLLENMRESEQFTEAMEQMKSHSPQLGMMLSAAQMGLFPGLGLDLD